MTPERGEPNATEKLTSHDVAEALRARMESGELEAGALMPSRAWFDALWSTVATDLAMD